MGNIVKPTETGKKDVVRAKGANEVRYGNFNAQAKKTTNHGH